MVCGVQALSIGRGTIGHLAIRAPSIPSIPSVLQVFPGQVFGAAIHSTQGSEDKEQHHHEGDDEDDNRSTLSTEAQSVSSTHSHRMEYTYYNGDIGSGVIRAAPTLAIPLAGLVGIRGWMILTGLQPLEMGRNIHVKKGEQVPEDLIVPRTCRLDSQIVIIIDIFRMEDGRRLGEIMICWGWKR